MHETHRYFKLYKPFGILSQLHSNDPKENRNKRFLHDLYNFPEGTMPVGRLDEKSEGLLLMTTDGKWADTINRSGVEKEYYAQLDGVITKEAIAHLKKGIEIGLAGKKYCTKSCKVKKLKAAPPLPVPDSQLRLGRHRPTSWISIILTEGKFRQVRKMTAAAGFPTSRLVRVRIGPFLLTGLSPGKVHEIDGSALTITAP